MPSSDALQFFPQTTAPPSLVSSERCQGVALRASGVVAGGRHVTGPAHVTGSVEALNRNKMAATGDDAAAMDSISRAPAVQAAAPTSTSHGEGTEAAAAAAAAESPVVVPKKPNTNSE